MTMNRFLSVVLAAWLGRVCSNGILTSASAH